MRAKLTQEIRNSGRARWLADVASTDHDHRAATLLLSLTRLSRRDATRADVRQAVKTIASAVVQEGISVSEDLVLVPIMRAGVAMLDVALDAAPHASTLFVVSTKTKGTDEVALTWLKHEAAPRRDVVVLDTVIASGDTIVEVCTELARRVEPMSQLRILTCYASPEGVARILARVPRAQLLVGCLSETVGNDGYVIPRINGDMGDKLYGP